MSNNDIWGTAGRFADQSNYGQNPNSYQQSFNQKEDYERQLKIQRDLGLMPPADRHPDVRFRGKSLTALSPEETFEALQQAITHLKALTLGGSDFSGIR